MTSLTAGNGDASAHVSRFRLWLGSTSKASLAVAAVISCCIFLMLGNLAGVPVERHFQGSLLIQQSPIVAILVVFVGLVVGSLVLNAMESADEPEIPLFGAVAGLATLSWRGGTMTAVLQNSPLVVFPTLAAELVLLGAIIFGCWQFLGRKVEIHDDDSEWNTRLLCAVTMALTMAVVMYFLCQTDAKKQVMTAVGISAFAGAATAYSIFGVRWAGCYLAAPILVGVAGYVLTYFAPGNYWHNGHTGQPLGYPLPLDYASLGTVGALLGFWSAQKWKHTGEDGH